MPVIVVFPADTNPVRLSIATVAPITRVFAVVTLRSARSLKLTTTLAEVLMRSINPAASIVNVNVALFPVDANTDVTTS